MGAPGASHLGTWDSTALDRPLLVPGLRPGHQPRSMILLLEQQCPVHGSFIAMSGRAAQIPHLGSGNR